MKQTYRILSFLLLVSVLISLLSAAFAEEIDYSADYTEEDKTGITNILLLGVDQIATDKENSTRSDCIMICSLNKDTGEMKLASIERAIYVEIPDVGKELLTNAHHYGGGELMQQLISDYFDVDLAGYVEIDYQGFIDIVDALGGTDVELSKMEALCLNGSLEEYYPENGAWVWTEVQEGANHLDGHDTLMYCRLRAIDSDWRRVERQRATIQCLVDKAKDATLAQIISMIKGVLRYTKTNLPAREICALIACSGRFRGTVADQISIPRESDPIYCDYEAETVRLHEFLYGGNTQAQDG